MQPDVSRLTDWYRSVDDTTYTGAARKVLPFTFAIVAVALVLIVLVNLR